MKKFRIFALISTIATYLLVLMGGLVRVTGSGLGCPDWPTCFGRWIPPTSLDQVPADMVAQFDITTAWIEYINRLCGVVVGLLILITAIWAIAKFRKQKRILYPAMAAAVLTALTGLQGSVVIKSMLEPVIITVHLILALIILMFMIYTTAQAYYIEKVETLVLKALPQKISKFPMILWIIGLIQVMLGTQIRQSLEVLAVQYPNLTSVEWLTKVGAINHLHMTVGIFLAAFTIYVTLRIWKYKEYITSLVRIASGLMVLMVMLQVFIGISFMVFATQPVTQLLHLWTASLFVGTVFFVFISVRKLEKGT